MSFDLLFALYDDLNDGFGISGGGSTSEQCVAFPDVAMAVTVQLRLAFLCLWTSNVGERFGHAGVSSSRC